MHNLVWDRGYLVKRTIDPYLICKLHFGVGTPFKSLVVGNSSQGADLYDENSSSGKPSKWFRVWEYGDQIEDLEAALAAGEFVVITQIPDVGTPPGKAVIRLLAELQEEYPEGTLHLHALYSYSVLFGKGFKSVDVEVRMLAAKGRVVLPPGKMVTFERAAVVPHWVNLLGMRTSELRVPRNRCMFNIRSAVWAGKYYTSTIRFRDRRQAEADPRAYTDPNWVPPKTTRIMVRNRKSDEGDKFLCDICSLQLNCRYFRTGSVCIVPDSEPAELASFFKTRDSDTIIEGLGTLLAAQSRRLATGMQDEEVDGKLSKEVTKIINTLFDRAVKLAKLVDPSLAKPNISFNFNKTQITGATPQSLTAAAVAELQARGISMDKITPEMIENLLSDPVPIQNRAIDAAHHESM